MLVYYIHSSLIHYTIRKYVESYKLLNEIEIKDLNHIFSFNDLRIKLNLLLNTILYNSVARHFDLILLLNL